MSGETSQLEQVFQVITDGILVINKDFSVKRINAKMCKVKDLHEKDAVGKKCFELFFNPICHTPNCPLIRIVNGEEYVNHELLLENNCGKPLPFMVSATPLRDADKHIVGIIEIFKDIADQKESEKALNESQAKYKSYLNQSTDGVFVADCHGHIVEINPAGCSLLGYNEEELLRMSISDILAPDSMIHQMGLGSIGAGAKELRLIRKDGSEAPVEINAEPLGDKWFQGTIRDITERKQMELKLRNSEQHYRLIFENSPLGVVHFDQNGVITNCNNSLIEIMGATKEVILGFNMVTDIKDDLLRTALQKAMTGTVGSYEGNYRSITGNRCIPLRATFSGIRSESGCFQGGVGIFEDITERTAVEEALRKSENHNSLILNGITEAVALYEFVDDSKFRILKVNRNFFNTLGLEEEKVIGKFIEEVVPADLAMKWVENNSAVAKCGNPARLEEDYGDLGIYDVRLVPVLNNEGKCTHLIATTTNISEQKKVEQHQLKIDKLESVGLLAGGIAHDFNNILTAIIGNASLTRMKIEKMVNNKDKERILKWLGEIERASHRAKELTQQLLTFAKGGNPILNTVAIGKLLTESAEFALSGSNVLCNCEIANDLWPVEIDEGQISQVIHNLVINATHAMPGGGVVSISADNVVVGKTDTLPLKKGNYVRITVHDHGHGIPKEHIDKIFDPYFSTKDMGSGLGLTTTYSVLRKHKGFITVESEVGVGTTFKIYLPASHNTIKNMPAGMQISLMGQGKVLVMDDEKLVRHVLSGMLQVLGYEAVCVKDGVEAVAAYTESMGQEAPFDIVIMDLTIPGGQGGLETIKRLREIDPEVKAVVSSGYSNNPVMADYKKYGFQGVVTKPYNIAKLGEVINSVMSTYKRQKLKGL